MSLDPYRLVAPLAALPATGYILWRAATEKRGRRYVRQRLGWGFPAGPYDYWIHCVSVGETQAALPLVHAIARTHPGKRILLSTCTTSGAETAASQLPEGAQHAYLPIDRHGAVRRFLDQAQPRCALIVETELWPNLFNACGRAGVPLFLLNGRLSQRTLQAPAWVRAILRDALRNVESCLARSEEDARRFERLGLAGDRIQVLGNLKHARTLDTVADASPEPPIPRPFLLAGSTHAGEEARLGGMWRRMNHQGRVLVIAPRHPKRGHRILQELKAQGLQVAVRSRDEPVTEETDIYLVDTLGELTRFMAHADAVFLGGSLVPRGGHNLLEPAAFGKPVVTGPHMENFPDETAALRAAGGAIQVADAAALEGVVAKLLADPERRRALGSAARRYLDAQGDVLARYLHALGVLYPEGFAATPPAGERDSEGEAEQPVGALG
ncbi:3-deoxy-D-manno-octulosonic acid transferase [Thiohalorhabdus denitrificans]|uniref:3-deoxy-D-manno-octulosonic acid transferase n=1 Tax=Thiohalorhabdus denitrificans TaxID=381306 RepID=A0A1G5C7X9_9GAMM|nr:3-deoxy-D-manno-octulosonic acid transferase [Thiohalorhabdus denitrificans]SCX98420.1 3-deoxy-D-manno-octulosonic-acid transferase [Thiohalorhabdus denitrificans]